MSSQPTPQQETLQAFVQLIRANNERGKLFNFHVENGIFSSQIYGTQKVFALSRAHFYYGRKMIYRSHWVIFFQGKEKPLFWNGR